MLVMLKYNVTPRKMSATKNVTPRKMSVTKLVEFNREIAVVSLDNFLLSAAWVELKQSCSSLSKSELCVEFNRIVQVWLGGCLPESVTDAQLVVDEILLKYFMPQLEERMGVEFSFFSAGELRQKLLPTLMFLRTKSGKVFAANNTHTYFYPVFGEVKEHATNVDIAFK